MLALRVVGVLLVGIGLPACTGLHSPPRRALGQLEPYGPAVHLNGAQVDRKRAVFSGDRVTTGARSQAIVRLRRGGYVQLDHHTDPTFLESPEDDHCVLIRILRGQMFVSAPRVCVQDERMEAVLHRDVNVHTDRSTEITVVAGRSTIRRPATRTVTAGHRVRVARGRVSRPWRLTPRAMARTVAWTRELPAPAWEAACRLEDPLTDAEARSARRVQGTRRSGPSGRRVNVGVGARGA